MQDAGKNTQIKDCWMPRGDKSSSPQTVEKRRASFVRRREAAAARSAERTLRRWVPIDADAHACRAWLEARKIDLANPDLTPARRLNFVKRAMKALRLKKPFP